MRGDGKQLSWDKFVMPKAPATVPAKLKRKLISCLQQTTATEGDEDGAEESLQLQLQLWPVGLISGCDWHCLMPLAFWFSFLNSYFDALLLSGDLRMCSQSQSQSQKSIPKPQLFPWTRPESNWAENEEQRTDSEQPQRDNFGILARNVIAMQFRFLVEDVSMSP